MRIDLQRILKLWVRTTRKLSKTSTWVLSKKVNGKWSNGEGHGMINLYRTRGLKGWLSVHLMGGWQPISWGTRVTQLLLATTKFGYVDGWGEKLFCPLSRDLLGLHLSGVLSPSLGLGRGKKLPQEASLGISWNSIGVSVGLEPNSNSF